MTAVLAPDLRPACAGADPELFFPLGLNDTARAAAAHTAHRYCGPCPVRDACARAAAPTDQGIWAGQLRVLDGTGRMHTTDLLTDPHTTITRKVSRT